MQTWGALHFPCLWTETRITGQITVQQQRFNVPGTQPMIPLATEGTAHCGIGQITADNTASATTISASVAPTAEKIMAM